MLLAKSQSPNDATESTHVASTRVRWLLLGGVIAGAAGFTLLLHSLGFNTTFRLWNVPTYSVPFLDLAVITGASQSYMQGYDPAIQNPGDPLMRPFNYPRAWYVFLRIPMTQDWNAPLGIAIIVLFLVSVIVFPGQLTPVSALLLMVAIASPALMLGYARVNTDFLIFTVMVISLLLAERYALASFTVILTGTLFKIIPILGVGIFLDKKRNSGLKLIAGATALTALYSILTFRDMILIFHNTPKGAFESYGLAVLPLFLEHNVFSNPAVREGAWGLGRAALATHQLVARFPYVFHLAAILLLLLMGCLGSRYRLAPASEVLRNLRSFWMGAGMYIGTFLLGNNYDYRLMFLLFTIPQLAQWATAKSRRTKTAGIVILALVFTSLWQLLIQEFVAALLPFGALYSTVLDEAVNWALYAGLIFLLASSLPGWVAEEIGSFFHRRANGRPSVPAA